MDKGKTLTKEEIHGDLDALFEKATTRAWEDSTICPEARKSYIRNSKGNFLRDVERKVEDMRREVALEDIKSRGYKMFPSEDSLSSWLKENISSNFHVIPEVWGKHTPTGKNIRIDFILYPREHLVNVGFIEKPFGVEVKHFDLMNTRGQVKKIRKTLRQSQTYQESIYSRSGRKFSTAFTLIFSNLSFIRERRFAFDCNGELKPAYKAMMCSLRYSMVGELIIPGYVPVTDGWKISFSGQVWASCGEGRSLDGASFSTVNDIFKAPLKVGSL